MILQESQHQDADVTDITGEFKALREIWTQQGILIQQLQTELHATKRTAEGARNPIKNTNYCI